MNWDLAIRRNTGELLKLVLWMLAGLGAGSGAVSRDVHLAILRTLRGVESAFRRLVVIAARGVTATVRLSGGPVPGASFMGKAQGVPVGARMPMVPLFDPRKDFGWAGDAARVPPPPRVEVGQALAQSDAAPLNLDRLKRRLAAVEAGLADLSGQALRLARRRARRALRALAGKNPGPVSPMRPGWPPGYRMERQERLHGMLRDLDGLARLAENEGVGA